MTNLDSILKSRDIALPKKMSSQTYGFSSSHVWMWELDYNESWASKHWCFWTAVLEKTLESPLDCKEIQKVHPKKKKSVLSVHWKDWCWSRSFNTLATWCEELTDSLEKTLMLGKIEGKRGREWQRMRCLDGITNSWTWVWASSGSWWWTGNPGMLQSMGLRSQTQLSNWTELIQWWKSTQWTRWATRGQ